MITPKETQLKILNKMIENVEMDKPLLSDIQYLDQRTNTWDDRVYDIGDRHFQSLEMRVKPEVLTLPEREIPKPLSHAELVDSKEYFYVCNDKYFYEENSGRHIKDYDIKFVYETKEEAIRASKLIFGLE